MLIAYPIPPFAPGRLVALPGRGTTFIRELPGPPGAPTLLMLHGWAMTGGLNWHIAMPELAKSYNVVAMDLRGHGRGLRDGQPFTYEAAADDAAALLDVLGRRSAIVAGFSMGGPIAEVMWRRHPTRVGGLVLASVTGLDHNGPVLTFMLEALRRVFAVLPDVVFGPWWVARWWQRSALLRPLDEVGRSDLRRVVDACQVLGWYDTSSWQPEIDVPTSVVISTRDALVPPAEQRAVAAAIPGASIISLAGGHLACVMRPERFSAALVAACREVAVRIAPGAGDPTPGSFAALTA